ncbi:hypothetical protein KAR91_40700 [Candidatus Pacearchaeota archaeon]|nr:hypothetical protein [Candidatus Pacearchaeota archaeon]
MPKQWNRVSDGLLPPKGRVVLLNVNGTEYSPACIVAGYLKRHSEGGYYFVTPGVSVNTAKEVVIYWSDCLGDDFQCPLWTNKTMNKG